MPCLMQSRFVEIKKKSDAEARPIVKIDGYYVYCVTGICDNSAPLSMMAYWAETQPTMSS